LLVRRRGEHDAERAELEDDQRGAEGEARRSAGVRSIGVEHAGMYASARPGAGTVALRDADRDVQVILSGQGDVHFPEEP
jgi:hypothetical protein